jgi:hypothetical protein
MNEFKYQSGYIIITERSNVFKINFSAPCPHKITSTIISKTTNIENHSVYYTKKKNKEKKVKRIKLNA